MFAGLLKQINMEKEIPRISFDKNKAVNIEVMNFTELLDNLNKSKDHDPFAIHKIEFYLILIITKNGYTHFVDFKPYKLAEGSALFVAKNQVHHFTRGLSEAQGFCVVFNSLFIEKSNSLSDSVSLNRLFNYHIETPVILQDDVRSDSFLDIANQLYNEHNFPSQFAKAMILSSLLHVLLLKAERAKENQSIVGVKRQWLELFNGFKNMLESEYVKTRNSRHYASQLLISYKFLNDIVKKLTGKTAKAFIDDYVTIEIKRYLVSTSLSVKEISYRTGFEEPSNLVKFFKKHTNTTPLKFREQQHMVTL